MSSRGKVNAVCAAVLTMLFLSIAPGASALTKSTAEGVDRGDGVLAGTAVCPQGQQVVSGGFSGPEESFALVNRATGERSWTVKAFGGSLRVFAYCSKSIEVSSRSKRVVFAVNTDNPMTATARCSTGRTAVSGGWKYKPITSNTPIFKSRPAGGRGWAVTGFNNENVPQSLTAYAYCAKDVDVERRSKKSDPIGEDVAARVTAKCRTGEQLLGGGFATSPRSDFNNDTGPDFFYSRSARDGGRGWSAAAHNYSAIAGRLKAIAICAS